MRILAASYAYPPLRYPRAIQVARLVAHLPPETTTVLCAREPGDGDRTLLDAYPDDGRRVVRVPWSVPSRSIARARGRVLEGRLLVPDRYRPWQRDAARAVRRHGLLGRGDVLVTFGQPMSDHLLGLRLAGRRGARWIAHFSDPWVDSPFRHGGSVTRALNARLEERVMRRADAIVFTSAETVELVMAKYSDPLRRKAHVIPHAHDAALYPPSGRQGNGILLRYLGNFYGHRGPQPLVRALLALLDRRPDALAGVRVELVGRHDQALPEAALAQLPSGLVSLRDPVDYIASLELMRSSDVLLVLDAPADLSVFLPSKLIDYLGARRPVVALTPQGAAAALVRAAGGWHADPSDPEAGATALSAALDFVRRNTADRWGRDEVVEAFAAPKVAGRFLDVVTSVRQYPV